MANTLSAADFTGIRLQYQNEQKPGEYPISIEHFFSRGTMVDHYFATPSPALLSEVAAVMPDEISGFLFAPQPDGQPWLLHAHELTMTKDVCFEMPCAEFDAMLAASSVTLPGEEPVATPS